MTTVAQVATAMQTVLTSVADRAGRVSGFVQRETKLRGSTFVQMLVFGWLADAEMTLEDLAQTAASLGVSITAQGVAARFTASAAACLQQVLASAVNTLIAADPVAIPLLQRFTAVQVLDSSSVALPPALAELWPGGGGHPDQPSPAALKVSVELDLLTGTLHGPCLQAGRRHDRSSPLHTASVAAGTLCVRDLGYFDLARLQAWDSQQVYWLTRLQVGTNVYTAAEEWLDLPAWLTAQTTDDVDCLIRVGERHRLACRLLAQRVPTSVAEERRRRLHTEARRKGQAVSQARLTLAEWTIYITNVPQARLSLAEALILGRIRWQIELLFKLWKSLGRLEASRSAQPWRMVCEVYAKLLALLVQHWISLVSCWAYPDRSLFKAAKTIRHHALHLACVLGRFEALVETLQLIHHCLTTGCRINKRCSKPAMHQLLAHAT
jgi:hypothetical protein